MPIFEYQCKDCKSKFEILHKSTSLKEEVLCPECHSKKSKKLISSFNSVESSNADFSNSSCATGSCDIPSYDGCTSGMCGLN
ncbi:MAG: zinc ribbon domain-containing protein [Ignavibacteria bacterium]|nr:zinc ribbon domain-containing protein [Ignavibacteria bacterium]